MLLATAQQLDLGESRKRKKKKKDTTTSTAAADTTTVAIATNDKTKSKKSKSRSTTKSHTKLSRKAVMGGDNTDSDFGLGAEKPISTSELTAATVTMTASERSEEDHPIQAAPTLAAVEEEAAVVTETAESEAAIHGTAPLEASATTAAATPEKKKTKKKNHKTPSPSPDKKKKSAKSSAKTKLKAKKSPSPAKKKSKKTTADNKDTERNATLKAKVEERLREIEKLEQLLKEEREALQSDKVSLSCDQLIMRYVVHQEAERTDQMALMIEGLQERVVRMHQQELAMMQEGTKERSKVQEHVSELQDVVQRQANEIQRLKAELRDIDQAGMVVNEEDLFEDMQTMMEENKDLHETKKYLEEQNEMERVEWQKQLDAKDEIIASLLKEIESLKLALDLSIYRRC